MSLDVVQVARCPPKSPPGPSIPPTRKSFAVLCGKSYLSFADVKRMKKGRALINFLAPRLVRGQATTATALS